MPQVHKARGRRADKKRKREEEENESEIERSALNSTNDGDINFDSHDFPDATTREGPLDVPFYGMLGEEEQEYFKRADSMLELNQFTSVEERNHFLTSVYEEAKGKELKIANSQSCSRLLERLICVSNPIQLKALFQTFNGHFINLCQHRFASHCCETLFIQAAPIVSQELIAPLVDQSELGKKAVYVSMENLFLFALNELQGNLGFLMTDPFASHTLRVLLLIFSGRPLGDTDTKSVVQSKKKENITVPVQSSLSVEPQISRVIPSSFSEAIGIMISGMTAGLDANSLRALTTHPIANPVFQLSLEIELFRSKEGVGKATNSLLQKLVPDESQDNAAQNESFIKYLAYDNIGSRLLEVIIDQAPENLFTKIYNSVFKDRMTIFAKNDVARFSVIRLLKRLSRTELKKAAKDLCSHIEPLIEPSRTSVIKALIESCRTRHVGTEVIYDALQRAYGDDPVSRLLKMLRIDTGAMEGVSEDRKARLEKQDVTKVHGSLLAQSMLNTPGSLRQFVVDGLMAMDIDLLVSIAKDRTASRTLQSSLALPDQDLKFRRVMLQRFYGRITDLAVDTIASHVIDQFWDASSGLAFVRQQIAIELLQHEEDLRGSFSGRVVWRNWNMDVFKTRRKTWISNSRDHGGSQPSGIELARIRYDSVKQDHRAKNASSKRG